MKRNNKRIRVEMPQIFECPKYLDLRFDFPLETYVQMLEFICVARLELKQIYEQEIQNNFELELKKYILNEFIIVEEKSISYGETFQPVLFENLEFEPYQDEYSVDKILQNIPKAIIEDPFLEISKWEIKEDIIWENNPVLRTFQPFENLELENDFLSLIPIPYEPPEEMKIQLNLVDAACFGDLTLSYPTESLEGIMTKDSIQGSINLKDNQTIQELEELEIEKYLTLPFQIDDTWKQNEDQLFLELELNNCTNNIIQDLHSIEGLKGFWKKFEPPSGLYFHEPEIEWESSLSYQEIISLGNYSFDLDLNSLNSSLNWNPLPNVNPISKVCQEQLIIKSYVDPLASTNFLDTGSLNPKTQYLSIFRDTPILDSNGKMAFNQTPQLSKRSPLTSHSTQDLQAEFLQSHVQDFLTLHGKSQTNFQIKGVKKEQKSDGKKEVIQIPSFSELRTNDSQKTFHDGDDQNPFLLISNTEFIQRRKLIQQLENEFKIFVIARDIMESGKIRETLIIDERTSILIFPLFNISQNERSILLIDSLICLASRFTCCWIILESELQNQKSHTYPFMSTVQSNLGLLFASVTLFEKVGMITRIVYSWNQRETCYLIKMICHISKEESENNNIWRKEQYSSRDWLESIESTHEKFLSTFPSFNCFTSQTILTTSSLKEIMSMTFDQMVQKFPWIPSQFLCKKKKSFHESLTQSLNEGCYHNNPNLIQ